MRTKIAGLSATVLVITSSLWLGITIIPDTVGGSTLFVGGIGSGNYSAIQSAIDASNPGDIIYVYGGTYQEHVIINKTVTLIGENRDTTVVDGNGNGPIINVTADWVNISRFNITKGGVSSKTGGIVLHHTQNCYLTDNMVSENGNGIWLTYASYNTISGNRVFMNMWDGIDLYPASNDNRIVENTIHDNFAGVGVYYSDRNMILGNDISSEYNMVNDDLYGVAVGYSNDNTIANNTVSEVRAGISLHDSDRNIITGNHGSLNHFAIGLFRSNNTIISNNTVFDNNEGISIGVSNNNTISGNMIYDNSYGVQMESSSGNRIYHNEFTDNLDHAYDHNGTNQWDDGYPSGGNYWDDYSAYDSFSGPGQNELGGDGIGDSPRQIEGGSCKDRYPILVGPPKSIFEEFWFWFALVLTVVVVGFAVFLLLRRRKKKEMDSDESPEAGFGK